MRLCIYALSYQLSYICFTSYHYINHWFIQLLYIFCMINVVRIWQKNIVLQNISGVTERVHSVRLHRSREKSCSFQRNTKMEFSIQFCLILTFGLLQKNVTTYPFWRVAKIIHKESFKHNICSIGISCAIVWFRCVHLHKQPPEMFLKRSVLKKQCS